MTFANAVYYRPNKDRPMETPITMNADALTHIYYVAARVNVEGSVYLRDREFHTQDEVDGHKGCIKACQALKSRNPALKILLSIGSGSGSNVFGSLLQYGAARERFVRSAKALVDEFRFDGLDVDWEHPATSADGTIFLNLVMKLRGQMRPPQYILTAALAGVIDLLKVVDLRRVGNALDLVNLMCYDFFGWWSENAGHQAKIYPSSIPSRQSQHQGTYSTIQFGKFAVLFAQRAGVPLQKILLGIPTFGRRFSGVSWPGQEYTHKEIDKEIFPYKDLPFLRDIDIDDDAVAVYWVHRTNEGVSLYSYDNPGTVERKADFVKEIGLAGLFYSGHAEDKQDDGSLILAGYNSLAS